MERSFFAVTKSYVLTYKIRVSFLTFYQRFIKFTNISYIRIKFTDISYTNAYRGFSRLESLKEVKCIFVSVNHDESGEM